MKTTDFSRHITNFLGEYLPSQRNVSPNTIEAYRDVFALLLRYCRDRHDISPERLTLRQIDEKLLSEFLQYLEQDRGCSSNTRNQRLAALRSFFRFVQTEDPQLLHQCQRILSIPFKRTSKTEVHYMTPEDVSAILKQPDLHFVNGRRDAVLLSLLYDTGARTQEIIDISVRDVRIETPAQVRLTGKNRKTRIVPLMKSTTDLLANYMREHDLNHEEKGAAPLFYNHRGMRLSRSGLRYILDKYVESARSGTPGFTGRISPHTFRHTKAMHLLQSGSHIVVIKHILGHTDISTTQRYVKADLQMKRAALEKASISTPSLELPPWQTNKNLLEWLRSL